MIDFDYDKGDFVLYKGELYLVAMISFKIEIDICISISGEYTGSWYPKSDIIRLNKIDNPEYYL